MEFLNVSDYEKFLRENGLYKEGARKIVITGQMADATELIKALEEAGHNVYPVSSFTRFMEFVREIDRMPLSTWHTDAWATPWWNI